MFSLREKITVVTGGGSGIGEAIATAFAAQGATVYVCDRDAPGAQRVATAIHGHAVTLDVTDEGAWAALAQRILAAHGRIDVLALNAGIGHVGTALTTTAADLDRLWNVNVKGVFHGVKAFLPTLIAQRHGSVVVTASIGGVVAIRDRLAYGTTKFAVVGLVKSLALDHADSGVRFNSICPGRVETPFVAKRLSEYSDPAAARTDMESTQALKRMGRPEEIAAAAVYLASDESAFITGSELIIDGGWTAGK